MVKRIKLLTRPCGAEGEIRHPILEDLAERREWLGRAGEWILPLDVYENESEIVIEGEVPGMDVQDLQITLQSNRIEIRGRKPEDSGPGPTRYLRLEREYGSFRRTLALPAAVFTEKAKAGLENGVLTIVLRKLKPARAKDKVVPIQKGEGASGGKRG